MNILKDSKTPSQATNESTHDLTIGVSTLDRTSSVVGKSTTSQSLFYRDKVGLHQIMLTKPALLFLACFLVALLLIGFSLNSIAKKHGINFSLNSLSNFFNSNFNGLLDTKKDNLNLKNSKNSLIQASIKPKSSPTPKLSKTPSPSTKSTSTVKAPTQQTNTSQPAVSPGAPGSTQWQVEFQKNWEEMSKQTTQMQQQVEQAQKEFCDKNPSLCEK